jgi:DNA-binding transcriptional regulator YbjK
MDNTQAIQEVTDMITNGNISHSDLMRLAAIAYEEEAQQDHRSDHE